MGTTPEFRLSRGLFLRLLAVVYLLAFASLAPQVVDLVGPDGLLPAGAYLTRVGDFYGAEAYRLLPTLLWLSADDGTLLALAWGGAGVSLLALFGIAPTVTFPVLWALYLSLTVGGVP